MTEEPIIGVGLLQAVESVSFRLRGDFTDGLGTQLPAGAYRVECREGVFHCSGPRSLEAQELVLSPREKDIGRFSLEATIGLEFHWQQKEAQTFSGGLRFAGSEGNRLTVINDIGLEDYLASVACSEMSASSPADLIEAHAVISRSWLLAQTRNYETTSQKTSEEWIRWYDRETHKGFDVCADDHCQRYHGIDRIDSSTAEEAVRKTRGQVLFFEGHVCDARYGKCCGGVTEDFRVAWSDDEIPYLTPIFDGPANRMPRTPLTEESAFREFLAKPPDVYCKVADEKTLDSILTAHDRKTTDFFRWKESLAAERAGELIEEKTGMNLGRIVRLEPVERGLSGRLKRLKLVGEKGSAVIGKELEIRRALSESHLYSSAFVIDAEGPAARPDTFILSGAGWGHGVGLCQIGAAVMARRGFGYEDILRHYYTGTRLKRVYE